MININDNYTNDLIINDINICKICSEKLFMKSNDMN